MLPARQQRKRAQRVGQAELAHEPLAFGQLRARLGRRPYALPVGAVDGELREPGVQLDLRRQHPDLLGEREGLLVGLARPAHVGLGDLELAPERRQGEDRLPVVGATRELHRPLQVLARLLGVADAAEHAPEDPVRAARGARLAEALGQPQRLLGRVDGEHVVARVEVEPGRLLVEAHQLEPRRPVLQQVDALLVVLDGRLALALVREPGTDLAMQVSHPLEVLLAAVPVEALASTRRSPRPRGRACSETSPSFSATRTRRVAAVLDLAGMAVVGGRLAVRVQERCGVARLLQEANRPLAHLRELAVRQAALAAECGSASVVLGEQRHHLVRAVPVALLEEGAHLVVLPRAHGLGQHAVGHVADQHVLEGSSSSPALGVWREDVLLPQRHERLAEVAPLRLGQRRRASPPRTCARPPTPAARGAARTGRASRAGRPAPPAPCRAARRRRSPPSSAMRRAISSANSGLPPGALRHERALRPGPRAAARASSSQVSASESGSSSSWVAERRPPPQPGRRSSSSSRARQTSSSGARTHWARCSMASSMPSSAQWMSSNTSTIGRRLAIASMPARSAEKKDSRMRSGSWLGGRELGGDVEPEQAADQGGLLHAARRSTRRPRPNSVPRIGAKACPRLRRRSRSPRSRTRRAGPRRAPSRRCPLP